MTPRPLYRPRESLADVARRLAGNWTAAALGSAWFAAFIGACAGIPWVQVGVMRWLQW